MLGVREQLRRLGGIMARSLTSQFVTSATSVAALHLVSAVAGVPSFIATPLQAAEAVRAAIGFISPYAYGNYQAPDANATDNHARNGHLPLTSFARMVPRERGGDQQGGGRSLGGFNYLNQFIAPGQETRQLHALQGGTINAGGLVNQSRAVGATSGLARQETRDFSQYDAGRIRAEIDTLGDKYRDHGMDTRPQDPNAGLPIHTIRDHEGRILMQGHAQSVEHLIAIKMAEAERATDPSKKVVNLAGANLGGMKLDFKGFNFRNVDMRGADLSGNSFNECRFENCDMQGANLKGVRIENSYMENVNLNGFVGDDKTMFKNSALMNVHMQGAHAPQIKFENIRAENLNMAGAYMPGASITNMHVTNLWAPEINLEGATIGGLHVRGPDSSLEDAKLNRVTLNDSSFGQPGQGINMRGIQMERSVQSDVQYNNSDLSGARMAGSDFKHGVDMRHVVTPRGPIDVDNSNLTGLTAGRDAKLKATQFTYGEGADKVSMRTLGGEEMVFDGTADIERLHRVARTNNLSFIQIRENDMAAIDPQTGRVLSEQEQRMTNQAQLQRRPKPAMAPSPMMPGRRKQPWET